MVDDGLEKVHGHVELQHEGHEDNVGEEQLDQQKQPVKCNVKKQLVKKFNAHNHTLKQARNKVTRTESFDHRPFVEVSFIQYKEVKKVIFLGRQKVNTGHWVVYSMSTMVPPKEDIPNKG